MASTNSLPPARSWRRCGSFAAVRGFEGKTPDRDESFHRIRGVVPRVFCNQPSNREVSSRVFEPRATSSFHSIDPTINSTSTSSEYKCGVNPFVDLIDMHLI